jgi:F-type H+-transporting ATPase subunit delta
MNRGPITVRYAKALFDLGKEKNILDKLHDNAKLLLEHCFEVKEFCVFLNNPVIKPSSKKEVLQKVLNTEQHPVMLRFVNLVIEKNREALLSDMIMHFETLYKKDKGIKDVKLITAVGLEKSYIKDLHTYLERELAAPVELETQVKPEILGGVVLIVNEKIVDNSITHQMKLIRTKLLS